MAIAAIAGLASAGGAYVAALAAGTAFGLAAFATAFAIGAGLSMVSRALAPKPNIGAQMRGITQTTREPASSRKIIYGRMRVGGQVVFISNTGDDNLYLHMAIAFASHEIQAYDEIWFNDNKVWTASGGFEGDWGTYVTIDRKFGTAGQAASTQLTNANVLWTSDHKLSGIAYIAFSLKWDADKFPQGVPNITAVIRGKKVYDPRDESIGYSQNPALCLRDYMLEQSYGLGEVAANLNDTSISDAADLCDEQVTLDAGGAQDRYQCNGVIDTANQIKANIEQLLASMGGRLTYSGGEYFVDGAEYKAPTLTFAENDIVSDIQTQTKQSRRGIYNGVKGIFVSEEKNFKVLDYPAQISSTYETEDGDPIYLDMPLPCVTNNTQAQRLAKIALLKSRQQVVMTMTTNLKGLRVKVGDTIQVTNDRLSYSSKVFEVIDYSLAITDGALGVNLSCIETASAIYDWTTSDEEDFLSGGELDLYDGRTVANVTNLAFTETGFRGPDGGVISAVELTWDENPNAFVELYKIRYNKTGTTDYFYASSREPRVYISGLDITSNYDFRVKAENLIGVSSSGTTLGNQVLNGDTTAPGVPTSTSATGGIQTITAEWSNPNDLDFKHVEVYVASTDSIPATPTSLVDGEEYVVTGLSGVETRYFWLKAVDFSGNKSAATASFNASSLTASSSDIGTGAVSSSNIADNAVGSDQLTDTISDIIDDAASRTEILNVQVESGDVLDLETGQDVLIQNLGDVAIFVNESNTTLNTSISTVQTTLSNLESTVVDLTSGTSDIFVQTSAPVAGVGGIPDPIPDFSRWYDSDDNNEPYYWDGTQWVGLADPRIASNASAITTLQSGLNTANSNISANSTAITTLDTTTVSQGSSITSLTSDVSTLQTDVTNAEGDISTNSTAITNLTTRVTDNEGDITSITSDVTTLQTDVTAAEGDITTNATAISGLTTRVTTAEGTITSQSSDITALENTVNDTSTGVAANASAVSSLDTRVTTAEGSITTNSSDITALETTVNDSSTGVAANANAVSSLDTRVTTAEGSITTLSSDVTTLQSDMTSAEGDITANSSALTALTTRVTTAEGSITTNSSDITTLETTVNDGTTGVAANSTAISGLDTRVTTAEGSITSQASDITALQTTVNDGTTGVAANASGLSSLTTRVTAAEGSITSSASDITTLEASLDNLTTIQDESDNVFQTESGDELLLNLPTDVASATSTATNALDARVTSAEGTITSQASDITTLQSELTTLDGDVTANAGAINSLTTRVTTAEGSITSQAQDITTLQSELDTAEGDISTNSTAISGLTTRVTTAEGTITSLSSDVTSLQSDLTTAEGDISSNASALTALTTRVSSAEGTITAQSSDITTLQSDLTSAEGDITTNATAITGLDTRVTTAEGTITSQSSDITALQSDVTTAEGDISTNASAITGLTTRVTTAEGTITSISSDVVTLQSDLTSAEGDISTNAIAITGLDTRVSTAEGTITSQSSDITTLQSDLTTAEGDISTNASAVSGLTTRVTAAEGDITTNASSITTLESTVNDPATGLAATATVASGASTTASANSTAITDLEAEAFLTVSAGGNVSGFKATADASGSTFTIQADQFALVSGDESQTKTPFAVDNTSGTVTFNADVEVNGDLIVDGTVTTTQIANNTITAGNIALDSISVDRLSGDVSEVFAFGLYKAIAVSLSSSFVTYGEFTTPAPDADINKYGTLHGHFTITAQQPSSAFTVEVDVERKSKGQASGVSIGDVVAQGPFAFGARYIELSGNLLTSLDMFGGIATAQTSPSSIYNVVSIEFQPTTNRTKIIFASFDVISVGTTIYYNRDKWTSLGDWITYAAVAPRYGIIGITGATTHTIFQPLARSNAEETYRVRAKTIGFSGTSCTMGVGIAGQIQLLT